MRPGMMPDGVALGRDPAHQLRVLRCRLADQEERRVDAFMGQRRQHPRRRGRPRAVIEGQHDLVIAERQRLRKAFQSRPAAWWRHRRRERARCRAYPCADSPPPGPPRSTPSRRQAGRQRILSFRIVRRPIFAGPCLSLRLALPYWVMRDATTQTSSAILSNRRGAAWPKIWTLPNRPMPRCSTVCRCATKMAKFATNSSRKSPAPSMTPIRRCCARLWRNSMRPISAT